MNETRRSRHWAAHALATIALAVVFVGAAAAGILLHAGLPVSKHVAARIAQDVLAGTLRGRVAIAQLDSVSFTHVEVPQATLFDTHDQAVIEVQKVRIDMSLRGLLTDLLFGATTGGIVVNHVEIHRAIVTLRADPKTGEPTLAAAVQPVRSNKPSSGPGPEVHLPSIEVDEGIVRSRLPVLPHFRARLRSVQGSVRAGPSGVAVDVRRFGVSLHQTTHAARGTGTFALRAPGPLQSTFEGFVGDVELRAAATLDGSHLDVTADAPRIHTAAAKRLLEDWPLTQTATAHLELRGDLPNLTARARATVGQAVVAADGPLVIGDKTRAQLAVRGEHLDARAFDANAPPTDVSFAGTANVTFDGERVDADAAVHTSASTFDGTPLPTVDATATLSDAGVKGMVEVHEPGAPIQASFVLHPSPLALDVDAQTGEVRLSAIERLGMKGLQGTGRARAHAHLEGGNLRATLDGDLGGIATAGLQLGRGRLHVEASGPLARPEKLRGTARLEASSMKVSTFTLDSAVVEARGAPEALEFDATLARTGGPSLKAAGQARLTPHPLLEKTRVVLEQGPVHVEGDVASLDLAEGSADIENVRVAGAGGTITGSVRVGPKLLEVTAEGEEVNLDTLGRAVGLPRGEISGTLRLSTDLVIGRDVTRGRLAIGLGNATLHTVGGLSLQLSTDLDDRHVTGSASGLVAGIGTFGTTFDAELGGPPLEAASWRDVTGNGEVQIGDVRLALISAALPKNGAVESIEGRGYARILLERKTAQTPLPSVFATLSTRDLAVSLREASGEKPLRIAGIDVTGTGQFDGPTGYSTGTTLAADAHGDLCTATGTLRFDVPRFMKEPARAFAQLVDTPVDVVFRVPKRNIDDLPEPLRVRDLAGSVSGMASVRGTLAHPTLYASLQGHDLGATRGGGQPVDVHGDAQYEWTTRDVAARATAAVGGRDVGSLNVRGSIPEGPGSFRGSARLAVDGLPIDALGGAGDRGISGTMMGTATLSRDEHGGTVDAELQVKDAFIAHAPVGDGTIRVSTSGSAAKATVSFQAARGKLDADGTLPLEWQGPLPSLGASAPVRVHVTMHDFAAAALTPATAAVLSRIGGWLDADLTLELTPSHDAAPGFTGGIQGTASLKEGSLLIDALGLQVNDLTSTAVARAEGSTTTVSIRDIQGKVRSSKTNLRGTSDIVIEGVRVTRGTAELDTDDMPILFRGAPQGRITGRANARLSRQQERMQVDIDLPKVTMQLPQSSTREVQQLGDNPNVTILQLEKEGPPEPITLPWRLALHIGSSVSLRRADVDLRLTGAPVIDLGEEAVASGSIDLVPGGRIPVLGKVFSVEDGNVVFDTGDPSNPHVIVHAKTQAGSDSTVYAEVTGTMRDAKIALRSDPPLPEAEVFALLVGGSAPDSGESTAGTQANAGGGAGAVALGTGVSMGVNQLVANSPVEVRVDTTEQNRPRYTAAVRLRENLWFEASEYQQDEYGAESTTRNVVSGTVDYRFARHWSLRTLAGNAGGALDLLWQYRY
jgi:translocation and assembly module TamB